jgi:hypothetical protein
LKKREDELQLSISELEAKMAELQEARLNESLSEFQHSNADNTNINQSPEVKPDGIISTSDELTHLSKIVFNDRQNENDTLRYPPQAERPFRPPFLDIKDLCPDSIFSSISSQS